MSEGKANIDKLVDRFLAWPVPTSVRPDNLDADGRMRPGGSGTNLLTADEAKQMLEYVCSDIIAALEAAIKRGVEFEAAYTCAKVDLDEARAELAAYAKAKTENDERFQLASGEWKSQAMEYGQDNRLLRQELTEARAQRDDAIKRGSLITVTTSDSTLIEQLTAANARVKELEGEVNALKYDLMHMTEKFERNSIAAGDYSLQLEEARAVHDVTKADRDILDAANISLNYKLTAEKAKSARLVEALELIRDTYPRETHCCKIASEALAAYAEPQDEGGE